MRLSKKRCMLKSASTTALGCPILLALFAREPALSGAEGVGILISLQPAETRECQSLTIRKTYLIQSGRALGNRVWKSNNPTHSGVTETRTMDETILPICDTHACPCSRPK